LTTPTGHRPPRGTPLPPACLCHLDSRGRLATGPKSLTSSDVIIPHSVHTLVEPCGGFQGAFVEVFCLRRHTCTFRFAPVRASLACNQLVKERRADAGAGAASRPALHATRPDRDPARGQARRVASDLTRGRRRGRD
jgi:hypothetical protein